MGGELGEALGAYRAGDWERALEALERADASGPDYVEAAYLLGLCHARLEHWDEALLYLEQVVTADADAARLRHGHPGRRLTRCETSGGPWRG